MDLFIEKEYLMRLRVLNYLINHETTLSEITSELQINFKTLKVIIDQLEVDINEAQLNQEIQIATEKGKISCHAKGLSFDQLRFYYLQHSFNYKVVEAFFFRKFNGVVYYADKEFISSATALRRIAQLRPIMEKFGLSIKLSIGEFVGEETQKRMFYFYFYWYSYQFQHILYSESWSKLDYFIEQLFEIMRMPMAYHLKRKYSLIFAITINRILGDRYVDYEFGKKLYDHLSAHSEKFNQFYDATVLLLREFNISESDIIKSEIATFYEALLTDMHLLPDSEIFNFKVLYPQIEEDSHKLYLYCESYLGKDKVSEYKEKMQDILFCRLLKSFKYYGDESEFIPFYKREFISLPFKKAEKEKLMNIFQDELPSYGKKDADYLILTIGIMLHELHLEISPVLNIAVLLMSHEYVVYYIKKVIKENLKDRVSITFYLKDDTDVIISDANDTKWNKQIPVYPFVLGNENWDEIISFLEAAIERKEWNNAHVPDGTIFPKV